MITSAEIPNHAVKEKVRLLDPLKRMRSERRVALIVFNLLLLAAVLMQLMGYSVKDRRSVPVAEPPAIQMELPK